MGSAGRSQPATPAVAGTGPDGEPGDVPGGGPIDETPELAAWFDVAWMSVCASPRLVFLGSGGLLPGTLSDQSDSRVTSLSRRAAGIYP
jgi:hypothetical protein